MSVLTTTEKAGYDAIVADPTTNLASVNARGVIIANYATTAALAAGTYANGTAGVGATFTVTAVGALAAIDGQTPALNDIVLVKDQASGLQNGVYKVTTLGDGSTSAALTRITAADTAAKLAGCNVAVALGTANANTAWTINLAAASITVGTTALTFVNPHTSATVPAALGTAAAGTSPHLARRDHVHAMPTLNLWTWSAVSASGTTATRYLNAASSAAAQSATQGDSFIVAPSAGTATAIYAYHDVANADTLTYTFQVNGVDSALTCQVAGSGTTGNATGASVSFNAGDRLSMRAAQSSTTAGAAMRPRVAVAYKPS